MPHDYHLDLVWVAAIKSTTSLIEGWRWKGKRGAELHDWNTGKAGPSSGHQHLVKQAQTALPEDPWVSMASGEIKIMWDQSKEASLHYEVCLLCMTLGIMPSHKFWPHYQSSGLLTLPKSEEEAAAWSTSSGFRVLIISYLSLWNNKCDRMELNIQIEDDILACAHYMWCLCALADCVRTHIPWCSRCPLANSYLNHPYKLCCPVITSE